MIIAYHRPKTLDEALTLLTQPNMVPLGGGMQWVYQGFLMDARAEYRFTSYGDLFANDVNTNDNMDRWGVQANIGYQF